jgi:exopolyphosphatase/guanosine-5'-triphosphate,3'-diphosphate pyrophosphatase
MERLGLGEIIGENEEHKIRRNVLGVLRRHFPSKPDLSGSITVVCGGNAEALARIAPGYLARGIPTLDMRLLDKRVAEIQRLSVVNRMKELSVRRDRAEVVAIAGIILSTLAHWLKIKFMLVPSVGLREGVIGELVEQHFRHKKKTGRNW